MAKALECPLLFLKDMDALKHMRQLELFLSLKKDLALMSSLAAFINSDSLSFLFSSFFFVNVLFCCLYVGYPGGLHGRGIG